MSSEAVLIHFLHRVGAVAVTVCVLWTVTLTLHRHRDEPWLVRPVLAVASLLIVQITLGAFTIWAEKAVLPTTAHVAVGAALLATSLILTLRSYRLLGVSVPVVGRGFVPARPPCLPAGRAGGSEKVPA